MTLDDILSRSLRRAGLDVSVSTYKTKARDYFNDCKDLVLEIREWVWTRGEGSLTTVADQREYDLATTVMNVISARDTSNDRPLIVSHITREDLYDPDEDNTGDPERFVVVDIDSTTGVWQAQLIPTPNTSGDTVKYRFHKLFADQTSSNDNDSLNLLFPVWVQRGMLHYVGGMMAGEYGNQELQRKELKIFGGDGLDGGEWGGLIGRAIDVDLKAEGPPPDTVLRRSRNSGVNVLRISTQRGSLG